MAGPQAQPTAGRRGWALVLAAAAVTTALGATVFPGQGLRSSDPAPAAPEPSATPSGYWKIYSPLPDDLARQAP